MTPEGVAVWQLFTQKCSLDPAEQPDNQWKKRDVLDPDNLDTLAVVLKETTGNKDGEVREDLIAVQKGYWNERPHFVWDILFDSVLENGEILDVKRKRVGTEQDPEAGEESDDSSDSELDEDADDLPGITLESFWKQTVDENLFAESATEERNYWGFQLFLRLIRSRPAAVIHPSPQF